MLVVIEGTDGSGKQTQTRLLSEKLRSESYRVETMAFPQYGKSHGAELVSKYLANEIGDVHPYAASMFYALDRAEHRSMLLTKLMVNDIVICDRYVPSNIAHQSARVEESKRAEVTRFIEWLEYEFHKMPRPQMVIFLRTTTEVSAKNREGRETTDAHEADVNHQTTALQRYGELAANCGWFIVDTVRDGVQRTPEAISSEILQLVLRQKMLLGNVSRGFSMNDLATVIFGDAMENGSQERQDLFLMSVRRGVDFLQRAWDIPDIF